MQNNEGAPMDFTEFPKMARLSRRVIITEKIDGTNACVYIGDGGEFLTGSRTRWITPEDDNFGFSRWAHEHKEELLTLGVGTHFGEWWGQGIQRKYGLAEKRWSLFNVGRWVEDWRDGSRAPLSEKQSYAPACCHVVPVLWRGPFDAANIPGLLERLRELGSVAAPGFMKPEGIVIFHTASGHLYKKTIEKDEVPKALQGREA